MERGRFRYHLRDAGRSGACEYLVTVHRSSSLPKSTSSSPAIFGWQDAGKRKPLPPKRREGSLLVPSYLATLGTHPTRQGNHHNGDGGNAVHIERCPVTLGGRTLQVNGWFFPPHSDWPGESGSFDQGYPGGFSI